MTRENAEYQALERVVIAEKRYRRFLYLLTFLFFVFVIIGGIDVQRSIEHKIDALVSGAVARNNARSLQDKTISRETTRYITCIFVLPIDQRTIENQQKCFDASDLPGGLNRSDFSPVIINSDGSVASTGAAQGQSFGASTSSSSNTTPQSQSKQQDTPQPSSNPPQSPSPAPPSGLDKLPVVGRIFKAIGL